MLDSTQKEKISHGYDSKKPERCASQVGSPTLTRNDSDEHHGERMSLYLMHLNALSLKQWNHDSGKPLN
jgi:hypothetical protein